jgi:hypothetical protein
LVRRGIRARVVAVPYTLRSMRLGRFVQLSAICLPLLVSALVAAQTPTAPRVLEFRFTPTARAQIALWIEKPDGTFVRTVLLTQAVGSRGIGNRPGAAEMNSGYHWPYGRREGALPIWAHRRAAAPGAAQFKRVIFQNRTSEGLASRTSEDSTKEDYFCLSFNSTTTEKGQLDAVSCASGFNSDKGRFMTSADVTKGYSEPIDAGKDRTLDLISLYPPRRDIARCSTSSPNCVDTADTATYVAHAREVMPEIDTVTTATPAGDDVEQSILFAVPNDWPDGSYVAWAEVNTEGDSNASFTFSTPCADDAPACGADWDSWAVTYGYSYRGQPSMAFSVPITIGAAGSYATDVPVGYGDVMGFDPGGSTVHPMDAKITNDPAKSPGSGADRFRLIASKGYRMKVIVRGGSGTVGTGGAGGGTPSGGMGGGHLGSGGNPGASGGSEVDPCLTFSSPEVPGNVTIAQVADPKHSHEWASLHFQVPASAQALHHYEVRVSETPITVADPKTFEQAPAANAATANSETAPLVIPMNGAAGSDVEVKFGLLMPQKEYYLGIRATNICGVAGPYAVAGPVATTRINFTKLSGCFVATAAFGSPLEPQVEVLRRVRDAMRKESAVFAAATDLYYRSGPPAAALIARSDVARAVVRTLLGPVVEVAGAVEPVASAGRRPPSTPAAHR